MKRPTEPTHDVFLKDVANHEMDVKLDQGVYRHIVFSQPTNCFLHRFELVTTPWRLMITGDMGTWVFARVEDMFAFFRGEPGKINCSYWAEKLQNGTHGCSDAAKVYDGDAYKERILDSLNEYGLSASVRSQIKKEIAALDFEDEHGIRSDIEGYSFRCTDREKLPFRFQDVWEVDMTVYSYHFVWCLYAIVWGIAQYDARDAGKGAGDE